MSDEARGDDVYQPQNDDGQDPPNDELDLENTLGERDLDDQMEEGYSPPERPLGVDKFGTTGEEEREGESLDQRLAQEVADVQPPDGDARAGRLTAADDATGRNTDVIAEDVGIDGGAASAEEAAVHVADEEDGGGREA